MACLFFLTPEHLNLFLAMTKKKFTYVFALNILTTGIEGLTTCFICVCNFNIQCKVHLWRSCCFTEVFQCNLACCLLIFLVYSALYSASWLAVALVHSPQYCVFCTEDVQFANSHKSSITIESESLNIS